MITQTHVPIGGDTGGARRAAGPAPRLGSLTDVLAAVDDYAARISEDASARDRDGGIPLTEIAALDASGLLGITVPRDHGGPGLGAVALAEVIRRIAVADPSLAQIPQGHFLIVDAVNLLGTARQRAVVFGDALAGHRIASAQAERGGRHAQDLVTRVLGPPADRRVTGRKYYCTGAHTAQRIAVNALNEDGRLVLALLDRDARGLELDEDWTAFGQRATVSGGLTLDAVPVEAGMELPYWRAFQGPQLLGARAQLIHTAIEVGIARAAVDDAASFLGTRSRPYFEAVRAGITDSADNDPHTLLRLGRIAARVRAAEQLLRWAAEQLEPLGVRPPNAEAAAAGSIAVAQAKAFATETAVDATSELFGICGASATDARWNLDRHWRNSRTHTVHDPSDWKYHHVGGFVVDGRHPPNHGQI